MQAVGRASRKLRSRIGVGGCGSLASYPTEMIEDTGNYSAAIKDVEMRPKCWTRAPPHLAGELFASQLQAIEISQDSDGNGFRPEEILRQGLKVFDRDFFDPLNQFV